MLQISLFHPFEDDDKNDDDNDDEGDTDDEISTKYPTKKLSLKIQAKQQGNLRQRYVHLLQNVRAAANLFYILPKRNDIPQKNYRWKFRPSSNLLPKSSAYESNDIKSMAKLVFSYKHLGTYLLLLGRMYLQNIRSFFFSHTIIW